jgi:polar amino acid transport system substrate-binding protein
LIPGLAEDRWHLDTGMFVTDARRRQVRFTRPVWAVPDGSIVRDADAGRLTSYREIVSESGAAGSTLAGERGRTALSSLI